MSADSKPAVGPNADSSLSSSNSSRTRVNEADQRERGHWGEQDEGDGVNVTTALKAYRQFSSRFSSHHGDEEEGADGEKFDLAAFVRRRQNAYHEQGLAWEKHLGCVWKDLSVQGVSSDASFNKDLGRALVGTFGPDAFNFVLKRFPSLSKLIPGYHVQVRDLLSGFTGSLKDEMLLVLGRPGSGCSTFLRAIANERSGFVSVGGEVNYGGLSAARAAKEFRGETIYNADEDLHFATLTVEQTLNFALANKVPSSRPEGERRSDFISQFTQVLLKMFAITHTAKTQVGDAMVRGVSGGERKRVSIAESLVAGGALTAWDNSTRGLDSSTALDYVRSLRITTDVAGRTNVVSLYQASENIWDLFDKVLLIDEGRCVFFGSIHDAVPYFEELGYFRQDRQTSADFLTTITDPSQRMVSEGFEDKCPRTAEEREAAYRKSSIYQKVLDEIKDVEAMIGKGEQVKQIEVTTRQAKSKHLPKRSPYTVTTFRSLQALVRRQAQLKWADRGAFFTKAATNVFVAFVVGSLFYNNAPTASSAFSFGGAAFLSLIFLGWLNLGELYEAVSGRAISARHASFAYYRPSAVILSQIILDVPLNLLQTTLYCVIFVRALDFRTVNILDRAQYFLAQLERSASAFFVFYLFVFLSTESLTTFFRAVAALSPSFDAAIRFSVIGLNIALVFVGYVQPRQDMHSALRWISYVHPLAYSFEAVLANQFSRITIQCDGDYIVPNVQGADPRYQTCFLRGATPGSLQVSGSDYIEQSFGYSYGNVWRDFGILIAFIAVYVMAAAIFSEVFSFANTGGASLVFIRSQRAKQQVKGAVDQPKDEEEKIGTVANGKEQADGPPEKVEGLQPSEAIFTWKDVCYSVDTADGERQLLDRVSGWVKPYETCALMGASGAGKTTLLNTLSLRHDPTRVTGEILVDGKKPPTSFNRSCGFAEQADIHDPTATVRESLEFAALLRQSRDIPREEKLKYVDTIMKLLDLEPLADALIGTPENGLSVEQKKRVTLGVELAAKPTIMTCMDEPTSGLDSNGAISIGKFIRRLSASGQGCLATIHQPSSVLLTTCFDRLLLLSPGGRTAFFGAVKDATRYFESQGARPCEPDENIAEYVLEVVGKKTTPSWGDRWLESEEHKAVQEEIERICRERESAEHHFADDREYAASVWEQTKLLTVRVAKNFWRDPSYGYGKIAAVFLVAFVSAFTFYMLPPTVAALQQRMFAVFLVILALPALLNASVPKHFILKGFWQSRESFTKTYGWQALVTAILVNEIPYALVCGVIYFALAYFPIGFPTGEAAGLFFLDTLLIMLFAPSFIHWLCALAVSPSFVANALPIALVTLNIFTGIIVPWSQMPAPWKDWLYWNNPIVYFLASELGAVLHGMPITCAEKELAVFDPPPGQSCGAYALQAIQAVGAQLLNPEATSNCRACQYQVSDQFLSGINVQHEDRWRDFGIFLVFTVFNFALVYIIFYLWQIKGLVFFFNAQFGKLASGVSRWSRPWNLRLPKKGGS